MPLSQRVRSLLGFVHRPLQLLCLSSQCVPCCDLCDASQTSGLRVIRSRTSLGMAIFKFVLSSLMAIELSLDSAKPVSAGTDQVSLDVF